MCDTGRHHLLFTPRAFTRRTFLIWTDPSHGCRRRRQPGLAGTVAWESRGAPLQPQRFQRPPRERAGPVERRPRDSVAHVHGSILSYLTVQL